MTTWHRIRADYPVQDLAGKFVTIIAKIVPDGYMIRLSDKPETIITITGGDLEEVSLPERARVAVSEQYDKRLDHVIIVGVQVPMGETVVLTCLHHNPNADLLERPQLASVMSDIVWLSRSTISIDGIPVDLWLGECQGCGKIYIKTKPGG